VPEDQRVVAAEEALQEGNFALAAQRYQAILDAEPGNADAALALGQVRLLQRVEAVDPRARESADATPADVAAQLAAADLDFAENHVDASLRRLLDALVRSSGEDRDILRARLVEYFDLLGPDDPRVGPARREMTRALF
jgi:putative thioredoxin